MSEIKIKLAAGTDVGLVRKNNEDNFVVNRDLSQSEWIIPQSSETIPLGKYGTLLVVADGMVVLTPERLHPPLPLRRCKTHLRQKSWTRS